MVELYTRVQEKHVCFTFCLSWQSLVFAVPQVVFSDRQKKKVIEKETVRLCGVGSGVFRRLGYCLSGHLLRRFHYLLENHVRPGP